MTKKRKPRVYNWIARGFKDAIQNTPYKHAPKTELDIQKIARNEWPPEVEQYMDGYEDGKKTLMGTNDDTQSVSTDPKTAS